MKNKNKYTKSYSQWLLITNKLYLYSELIILIMKLKIKVETKKEKNILEYKLKYYWDDLTCIFEETINIK